MVVKSHTDCKESNKTDLFAGDRTVYLENLKDITTTTKNSLNYYMIRAELQEA